jgi:predicted DNA-binding transcriptional regulator YafY
MGANTPGRLLKLLSLLQSRREWPGGELAERLGVTGRTVRRDVDRLRELGYPIQGTTGIAGGYRLVSGRDLPPLLLDDDEAVAVAVSLRTAAGGSVAGIDESSVRALAKLEQVLPARLRERIAAVGASTVPVLPDDGPRADPASLATLAGACRDHEVVSFEYRSRYGRSTSRRVEPHGLVTWYGRWLLVAYDVDAAGWRTFRLDRLTRPAPTRRRFTPRPLPAPDLAEYVTRSIATAPYRYTARATIGAPASEVTSRVHGPIPGQVEALDERTCTVRLGADSLDLIAQAVAGLATLGVPLSVEASPEVLGHLRSVARRLDACPAA